MKKKKTIKLTGGNGTFLPLKSERKKDQKQMFWDTKQIKGWP